MSDDATIEKETGLVEMKFSPLKMEPTMELRWAVEPGTSTKEPELQQAFQMIGETSKRKVWCPVPFKVLTDD